MATEANLDLDNLSPSQREALQQYTDVTGQEINDAIPLFSRGRNGMSKSIAIAKFFDGEGPDPLAEAQAAHNSVPRPMQRHENLHESFLAADVLPHRPPRRPQTEPAPRVVPQPSLLYRTPLLVKILFAPFRFGYKVLAGLFGTVFYFLSFLPQQLRPRVVASSLSKGLRQTNGRRVTLPKETAQRFRRDFEEEYGTHDLPFFEGGHAQALDAAKKDLKFLLTVLISPEHDITEAFVRNTLLSPEVVSFINDPANNMILWGGNVLDSEAYQVAREYNCSKYPFSCLVCLTPKEGSTRMGIVKRLVGPMSPESYLAAIQTAIAKYGPDLNGVRAERAAQEMTRNLRDQQDSAYERSLAADRERARQKREAAAAAAQAEKRAQEEAEAVARLEELRQRWRKWRATTIAPEPEAGANDTVRLALNMPASAGTGRLIRRFAGSTSIEELYAFVECHDLLQEELDEQRPEKPEGYNHGYGFRIASVMPRETFEPSATTTVGEKMGRGGTLVVEDISPDEEGEGEDEE
ncbi:UBX domain-containing protein 10 [Collariella sp. IMI 366227]|nr:UBX domain-containing protein 10 [Collariella sp. IMI 366227]